MSKILSGGSGFSPMHPDVVKELETVYDEDRKQHLPAVKLVKVNGDEQPMLVMSMGGIDSTQALQIAERFGRQKKLKARAASGGR